MEFDFSKIEEEVKEFWKKNDVFRTKEDHSRPKYFGLDMFPYPSGAGLHVGHPLGYVGSDIIARYKRLKGFNVLHPMGYDSFGLPAEQYAIQTGQHPAVTTERNIKTFREQMDKLGFSFDWSREVRTSDPQFYKWTQWIFIQLFHSWYNKKNHRAENIRELVEQFENEGNENVNAAAPETEIFTAGEWKNFSKKKRSDILLNYRLAYIADSWVNWCAALGTVLANDEVKDGVSERGGYPVERKLMKQWSLRITAYAERLLTGLDKIDWSESIKESQRNWIGKSEGCSVQFAVDASPFSIEVFTTRPDTIFGATFITLAPEHELVNKVTPPAYAAKINEYVAYAKNRSERDRMTDVKKITGQFTGAFAVHPFSGEKIPIWIGEYVLATYGTGAVMAVPAHDGRDYAFAKFFENELRNELDHDPIVEVIKGGDLSKGPYEAKEGICINSGFLNGLEVKEAIQKAIDEVENRGLGKRKVNYKLRDAIFGRQRYWGEPIPIYYDEEGIPQTVAESDLPVVLPEVDKYLPTESGEPPLARAVGWKYKGKYDYELTTMPGWAGSSWYYLRYEDPNNRETFASKEAINYWQNIDLYVGGDEHAVGHLLYFRFWTKFLFDLELIPFNEPAKKLVNQGKIQGISHTITRKIQLSKNNESGDGEAASAASYEYYSTDSLLLNDLKGNGVNLQTVYVPLEFCEGNKIDLNKFSEWIGVNEKDKFHLNDEGMLMAESFVEKMSKSKYNVVNPDDVVKEYGADAFRMYEMFLGPIEQHKPWDTKGIDGVYRFLKKLWRLFYSEEGKWVVIEEQPTNEELKILHRTIKKAEDDVARMAFNTSVSAFMICVNELSQLQSHKKALLEPLVIIISPYAPFLTEYLWKQLGHETTIADAAFPPYDESLLIENSFEYPVAINGKTRVKMVFPLDHPLEEIESDVKSAEGLQKYFDGKPPKKIIVVKGRMINVVV
jgi:leucyl-tRNA synthetase